MKSLLQDPLAPWQPGIDGSWDRAAAAHLFRRAGFGARPAELAKALARGMEATLDELVACPPDPERSARLSPLLATANIEHAASWWMDLCTHGAAKLVERTTLFWHDHFATSFVKVGDVRLMHAQNELLRTKGLGDFRELLAALLRDPAMLVWLDGDRNSVGAPNENLARELCELFALGIGTYTEEDVREAARALTGYAVEGRRAIWKAERHDRGSKTIFGRTGTFTPEQVVEIVAASPACALHVARRLVEEFVGPTPGAEVVQAVALRLQLEDWHIGRTLRALLASRTFFAPAARRARIAGPVELVAATVRTLDLRRPPSALARAAKSMGQALFEPPSVKGWDGGRAWIHAGTWIARTNWLAELAAADELLGADFELVLERLAPEGVESAQRAELERAARGAPERQAARDVARLWLTSPDYHLY